jgi:hypothetical protein
MRTMQSRTNPGVTRLMGLAIVATLFVACGDLEHTNPVDPETPISILVQGPPEVHSLGQEVHFTFTSTPEWTFSAPDWRSSDSGVLGLAAAGGIFVSKRDGVAMVTVQLGPHISDPVPVQVVQVAAGVKIRTCDGRAAYMSGAGYSIPVCAFVHDSIGSAVAGRSVDVASNDTAIVVMSQGAAIGVSCGSTFLVASSGPWSDTLRVQVCP